MNLIQFIIMQRAINRFMRFSQDLLMNMCPVLHKLLFVLCMVLIFCISHYALLLVFSSHGSRTILLWFTSMVWTIFSIVFNYVMCNLVNPGSPLNLPSSIRAKISYSCRTCGAIKPPRCHHCSICNECVLQMDHHCPWIGACVGHHNRRYFLNFLTYLTIGLSQTLILMLGYEQIDSTNGIIKDYMILFPLIVSLLVCVGCFTIFHWYIALKGKSSLQFCWDDPRYTPSNSKLFNLKLIYGTSNIFMMLLPHIDVLENSGYRWDDVV